jgi:hypothetical protein
LLPAPSRLAPDLHVSAEDAGMRLNKRKSAGRSALENHGFLRDRALMRKI